MFFLLFSLILARKSDSFPKQHRKVGMGINYFLTHFSDIPKYFKHKKWLGIPMYYELNASKYIQRLCDIAGELNIDTGDFLVQHFGPYLDWNNDTEMGNSIRIIFPDHRLAPDEIFSTPFYEQTTRLEDETKNNFIWVFYVDLLLIVMLGVSFIIIYRPLEKIKSPQDLDKFYNAALICSGLSFFFLFTTWFVFGDIKSNLSSVPQIVSKVLRNAVSGIESTFLTIDQNLFNLGESIDTMEDDLYGVISDLSNTLKGKVDSITSVINSNELETNPYALFQKDGIVYQKLVALNQELKSSKTDEVPKPDEVIEQVNAIKTKMLAGANEIVADNEEVDLELRKLNNFFKLNINVSAFKGLSRILPSFSPKITGLADKIGRIKLGKILSLAIPAVDFLFLIFGGIFVLLTCVLALIYKSNFQFKSLCTYFSIALPILVFAIFVVFIIITSFLAILSLYFNNNAIPAVQAAAQYLPDLLLNGTVFIPELHATANVTDVILDFYVRPYQQVVRRPITLISNLVNDPEGKTLSEHLDVQNALGLDSVTSYIDGFGQSFYSQLASQLPKLYQHLSEDFVSAYLPEDPKAISGMPDFDKIIQDYEALLKKNKGNDATSSTLIELKCILTGDPDSCASSQNTQTFDSQYQNFRNSILSNINYLADPDQMATNLREISPKSFTTLENVGNKINAIIKSIPGIINNFPADFVPGIYNILYNVVVCDLTKLNTRITLSIIFAIASYVILTSLIYFQKLIATKGEVCIEDSLFSLRKGKADDSSLLISNQPV